MSRAHAWAWGIAAVVAAGCGSVSKGAGGTGGGVGSDAGTDVGGDVDRDVHADSGGDAPLPGDAGGSDAARVCDITRAFGTPVLLAGVNSDSTTVVNDDMARLSPDELTIYFTSDRPGGTGSNNDIYTATRTSRSAPFGAPLPLGGINTPAASEAWPTLTSDGLTLFFESTTSGSYQVLVATRTTLVAQFSAAVPVANLNAGPIDGQPFVLPDESALYFASSRTGTNGGLDLYRAARGGGGAFGTPAQLATVNTPSQEYAPTPTANELTLYFSSDRTDAPSKGDHDIWVSQRTSTAAAFSPPVNVQELNTAATEWPDWLSPDNCRLYFTRRETTGRKIYVAERAM